MAFLWQAVCVGRGGYDRPGDTFAACCRGALGRAGLWSCRAEWGADGCTQPDLTSPAVCPPTRAPPLWASPLPCALLTCKAVSKLVTASGQDACCLGQGWESRLVMMQDQDPPLPLCNPLSHSHPCILRAPWLSLAAHPELGCVMLPLLCEGELWPMGRMVVLSLRACAR